MRAHLLCSTPLSLPHCLSLPPQRSHLLRCLYHPRHQHQHHKAQKVLGREAAPLACLRHQRARARGAQAAEEHRHGPVERAHTLIHKGVFRQLVGCCKRGWKRGIAGRVRRVAWTPLPPLAALLTRLAHTSPMLNARQECSDTSMSSRSSEGGSDSPRVPSSTAPMREAARGAGGWGHRALTRMQEQLSMATLPDRVCQQPAVATPGALCVMPALPPASPHHSAS